MEEEARQAAAQRLKEAVRIHAVAEGLEEEAGIQSQAKLWEGETTRREMAEGLGEEDRMRDQVENEARQRVGEENAKPNRLEEGKMSW